MSTETYKHIRTYLHNVLRQLQRMLGGKQTWREAMAGVSRDTRKLKLALGIGREQVEDRKKAVGLARRGRDAYNSAQFAEAERLFEAAAETDPSYALAYTYLGHSLYKQNRVREAEAAWKRAAEIDPDSTAAVTARKKLQHVSRDISRTIESLHEQFKE